MSEDTQFESFKTALAGFMHHTNALVDHVLSDEAATQHLTPLIPWVSEAMSAAIDPSFLEKIAMAYWSHMGMTSTSTPARLKIMELDGLSEAIQQSMAHPAGSRPTSAQNSLLNLCGLTVSGLLEGMGNMFPWVNGILRSTMGAGAQPDLTPRTRIGSHGLRRMGSRALCDSKPIRNAPNTPGWEVPFRPPFFCPVRHRCRHFHKARRRFHFSLLICGAGLACFEKSAQALP